MEPEPEGVSSLSSPEPEQKPRASSAQEPSSASDEPRDDSAAERPPQAENHDDLDDDVGRAAERLVDRIDRAGDALHAWRNRAVAAARRAVGRWAIVDRRQSA